LGSLAFLLVILIILITIFIAKRFKASEKCQERMKRLKKKLFYNPIIRYFILNSLKLAVSALVAIKAGAPDASTAVPVTTLTIVNLTPLLFLWVGYLNRDNLDREEIRSRMGSIYTGKNVQDKEHRAYLYPLAFFWRRILFAVATVYLLEHPALQIIVHYLLTMLMVVLLLWDGRAFESQSQRLVEIGSEFLLHLSSIMLAQFINPAYSSDEIEHMEVVTLVFLGLLLALNIIFILWFAISSCMSKRRTKAWLARLKLYEAKIEEKRQANLAQSQEISSQLEEVPPASNLFWKEIRAAQR